MVAPGDAVVRCDAGEGAFLDREVGVQVDLGGLDAFVAELERDHGDVDTAVQQLHYRGVPQDMRREVLIV